jgi:hypothetical protein
VPREPTSASRRRQQGTQKRVMVVRCARSNAAAKGRRPAALRQPGSVPKPAAWRGDTRGSCGEWEAGQPEKSRHKIMPLYLGVQTDTKWGWTPQQVHSPFRALPNPSSCIGATSRAPDVAAWP